jgi:tetratricopeptide (TPR) repeat protein
MRSALAARSISQYLHSTQYLHRSIIGPVIMGIVGNLRTMQLEELLQWLSQSKKSGTLEIVHGKTEKKIFFKDGLILSSASNKPEEYLGHFLMSHGLINEGQLSRAVELQEKSRMLLGMILVNNGAIAERDLARMLRLKAEESIYDIFSWAEGDFRFLDDVLPDSAMVPMRMDVTGIVMEGVQRVDEWRRIRQVIPHEQMIPVAIVDLSTIPGLGPGEQRILSLINDERSIEEIRQQTHATEYQTCKLVFDQWQLGRLKLVKLRGGRPAAAEAGGDAGAVRAEILIQAGRNFLSQGDFDAALRHLRAARALEPENPDALENLNEAEKRIREQIERSGVTLASVPQVTATMEQLTSSNLSPQEGFMLTRINGTYDIQSILKITPMPQLDALMLFWKLASGGYIRLLPPRTPPGASRGTMPLRR